MKKPIEKIKIIKPRKTGIGLFQNLYIIMDKINELVERVNEIYDNKK